MGTESLTTQIEMHPKEALDYEIPKNKGRIESGDAKEMSKSWDLGVSSELELRVKGHYKREISSER